MNFSIFVNNFYNRMTNTNRQQKYRADFTKKRLPPVRYAEEGSPANYARELSDGLFMKRLLPPDAN